MFISPSDCIEISDDDGNLIKLKARMDLATDTAVTVEFNRLNDGSPRATLRAYQLALLRHNIIGWEGPAFTDGDGEPIPCSPAQIGRLDPGQPMVAQALAKIDELNAILQQPGDRKKK